MSSSPTSVLIVDDSPDFVALARRLLELDPQLRVVATAADADQAVVEADRHAPDVVLIDVTLPIRDGFALAAMLRGRPCRVIICSVRDDPSYPERARRAGAAGFLSKDRLSARAVRAILSADAGDR